MHVLGDMVLVPSMPDRDTVFRTAVLGERTRLLGLAFTMLRDAGAAEDAVQSALEICWRSWDTVRDESRRSAWMTTICVRQCLRVRTWRLRRPVGTLEEWDAAGEFREPDVDLDRAYQRLSRRQRAVVVLHYHYGYTLDECASLMNCRPGTARQHLARALASLRRALDQ